MKNFKWWQSKIVRWGIWWYHVKAFKWPVKVVRMTVWSKYSGGVEILIYYKVGRCIYYKQVTCNYPYSPFLIARFFMKYINAKENFYRRKF